MPDLSHPNDPFQEHEETPQEAVAKATIQKKAGIWAMAAVACFTAILGIVQIKNQITKPLLPKYPNSNFKIVSVEEEEFQKAEKLRGSDTDEDGLNDYDELYVFETSPYLADSDSDGSTDFEELQSGQNPNCPVGQQCNTLKSTNTNTTDVNSSSTNTAVTASATDIDVIRETLKNAGAPATTLDAMTDEELITLYNETVQETGYTLDAQGNMVASGQTNQSTNQTAVEQMYSDFQPTNNEYDTTMNSLAQGDFDTLMKLTPAEIRELLISLGGDENFVNSMDDATITEVFQSALEQQQTMSAVNASQTQTNTNNQTNTNE